MIERVVILSTGDELTTGRIVDTNANWLATTFFEIGVDVVAILTTGDYPERLEWGWREALSQADLVVSTGGIGPTADDLTSETVARVLGRPLVEDAESVDRIKRFFASVNREMPLNNLKQALMPEGYVIVPNPLGTAPGYRVETNGKHIVVLPGVPREMKPMVTDTVLPWVQGLRGSGVYVARTFQTFGITESGLDEIVTPLVDPKEARLSYRASFPEISLRVVVQGEPADAERRADVVAARVREVLGTYCYGEGVTSMEEVVGHLLKAKGMTIALAESCTGGLVNHRLTNIPGSSAWVLGGVNAYANSVKKKLLGVSHETLKEHGAVSKECAGEMADGVRKALGADIAVSTTGVAGPDGGTPDKPVGTVCFGLSTAEETLTARFQLWGTRDWVKLLASQVALEWVRRKLLGVPIKDFELFRRSR